jgi:signal transduction histidine kinase/HAMP domain-containing protein
MYFSLKQKIFYTLFLLLLFMALLFLTIFQRIYGEEYAKDQNLTMARNQYIVELLHENIQLQHELNKFNPVSKTANNLEQKEEELSYQKQINAQIQSTYNLRWKTFVEGGKIIAISSVLSLFLIMLVGFLLQRWVIAPIDVLTETSRRVASGDYTKRVDLKRRHELIDEMDTLARDFNLMIDNIEKNIAEIQSTELFLQSLIDAIPDGVRVIDRHYNIVMVNKAYIKQTGDVKPTKCYCIYHQDTPCAQSMVTCPLRKIKNTSSGTINIIHNVNHRPLAVNAAPLKIRTDSGQDDFYIVEVMRDLSEDIRFSHEQKISSLGFLATSVAHEMKNNLGAVRMILEGLLDKRKLSKAEQTNYLQMVYKQIIASIRMPERLLRLARNNSEETEVIDVNADIAEVVSLLDYEAKRNGVLINLHAPSDGLLISGNAADFQMIILNLAQNAFKAMPTGGQFDITVSKNRNHVIVELKDTGIGIEQEKISHIFEPFYSDGRHSLHKGTGLGLAIVKSLVEKFKGQIEVSSILQQGTVFEIKFPRLKRNNLHS